MATTYTHISQNKRKSVFLLIFFVIFIALIGWAFSLYYGNYYPLIMVSVFAVVYTLVSYFNSDKIALALHRAVPLDPNSDLLFKKIDNIVENLAITAGIPKPKVYLIPDDSPNAFATGRNPENSSIALTTGIIKQLEKSELEGVIAHELSHVGNYDIRFATLVAVLVGMVMLLSRFFFRFSLFGGRRRDSGGGQAGAIIMVVGLVFLVLAPIVAQLIKFAISRKREFLADADAALLTRNPEGLANALRKIDRYPRKMRYTQEAMMHMYIGSTRGKRKAGWMVKLFSTHPPVEERVAALSEMGGNLPEEK